MRKRMESQRLPEDQFQEYITKWDADFEKTASFMVRSSFLIDHLSGELELHAEESDFQTKMAEFAKQSGVELARVTEFYSKSDRRSRLLYQIVEEKVIAHLMAKADIKDVSREEIEKLEPKEA
jgi:trigger factor